MLLMAMMLVWMGMGCPLESRLEDPRYKIASILMTIWCLVFLQIRVALLRQWLKKQAVTGEAGNVGYLHVYGCDVGNLGSGEGSDERSVVVSEGTNKWEMNRCVIDVEKTMKKSEFIYGEKEKERFDRILKRYEGTHNFHNFTTRMKAEDPSARRYIVSFDASTVITVEGIDFVKCEVVGQSFMLHQIRKMIGRAVAIMRNCAPESFFDSFYVQDVNINI